MAKCPHRIYAWLNRKTLIALLISAGFTLGVEFLLGWSWLLSPWLALSWQHLSLAILLTLLTYALRAWRVYDYYQAHMRGRFLACVRLTLLHNALNNLLPMRTGELSFPLLMARYFTIPAAHSIGVLLWFRLLDLHTLALFAGIALGGFFWGALSAGLIALLWLSLLWPLWRLAPVMSRWLAQRPASRLQQILSQAFMALPTEGKPFIRAWLLTLLNWLVKLGVFAWILLLFIPTASAIAWLAAIGADLSSILPVHGIAGMGSFEAGALAVLVPLGVPWDKALQGAINLHIFVLASALLGAGIAWWLPGKAP